MILHQVAQHADDLERAVAIAHEPHVIFTDNDGQFGPAGAHEWMAFITDSEGNLVGLASQNIPAP